MSETKEAPVPGPLRHGRSQVGVSTLAAQWYCEQKIELQHRHPEIRPRLAALDRGSEAHEQLSADAVRITREDLERDVAAGKELFLQETRFEADIEGVSVVGVPDLVHLQGRRCDLVLELKFSRRPTLFVDRFIQAQTYGLLLDRNGYELRGTPCVVGVVPSPAGDGAREDKLDALKRTGLLHAILDRCRDLRRSEPWGWKSRGIANPLTLREGPATLQAFPFDPAAVLGHLRWAFDYWKSLREPTATDMAAKCKVCPYNAARVCRFARSAPDRAFRLRPYRDEEGRELLEVSLTR